MISMVIGATVFEPCPSTVHLSTSPDTHERCLRARVPMAQGELLATFGARARLAEPSRMTIQIDIEEHIELEPSWLRFLEHSCAPNVAVDVERGAVNVVRPIAPGETLTYFYPSTEWAMAAPFVCRCGTPECLGIVAGASQLAPERLMGHALAPHIRRRLAHTSSAGAVTAPGG